MTQIELMELRPECVAEYRRMHAEPPPGLVQAHRDSGFQQILIFIRGTLVIVVFSCDDFAVAKQRLAEQEVFKKWTAKVRSMLVEDPVFFGSPGLVHGLTPDWTMDDYP